MATKLTRPLRREVETDRGRRFVDVTPHGVVVREPGKGAPPPVPFEAIEDLGWKLKVASEGTPVPRPRRGRRK